MTRFQKTLTSTVALLSLAITMPLPALGAESACLDEVAQLRLQLESGKVATLDLDAESENKTETEAQAETGFQTEAGLKTETEGLPSVIGSDDVSTTGNIETADSLSTAGTASEAENNAEGDVVVETTTGDVTVSVSDGLPRENWFGYPPADQTAEDYLDGAETAAKEGDQAACLELLDSAKTALSTKAE